MTPQDQDVHPQMAQNKACFSESVKPASTRWSRAKIYKLYQVCRTKLARKVRGQTILPRLSLPTQLFLVCMESIHVVSGPVFIVK